MADYFAMDRAALTAEKAQLEAEYKKFQGMGLNLNMARGKPGPHQMDLAMDMMKMTDYTAEGGVDARNYGNLEGLYEARVLFADVMGVKPEEVFVGGNSSLQLMYTLLSIGYMYGYPESPCPWSQLEKRKFLCPVPGYDRHFAITEEMGFEMINIPMTENGPDMDMIEKLVAEDDTIKGIWCVPQYSNPDGYTYSDETIRRFMEYVRLNKKLRKETEGEVSAALRSFVAAGAASTPAEIAEAVGVPVKKLKLKSGEENIMSVRVPKIEIEEEENSEIFPYSFASTSSELDASVKSLRAVMVKLIKLAEVEKTCAMLADEIEKTRRRVNALEYVMIPDYQETIKYISMKLDENERANTIRLMKVKQMLDEGQN